MSTLNSKTIRCSSNIGDFLAVFQTFIKVVLESVCTRCHVFMSFNFKGMKRSRYSKELRDCGKNNIFCILRFAFCEKACISVLLIPLSILRDKKKSTLQSFSGGGLLQPRIFLRQRN